MLTLKRIHGISQTPRHLAIYDEKLYELITPQYKVIDTQVMNGVKANKLNNINKRNRNFNQWKEIK